MFFRISSINNVYTKTCDIVTKCHCIKLTKCPCNIYTGYIVAMAV